MRNCTVTTTILLAVRTCGFYSCSIPADEGKLRGMFSRLSLQTVYRRFHTPYLQVSKRMAALFTKVDRYRRGVVAVVGTEIVGHAMHVWLEDHWRADRPYRRPDAHVHRLGERL
jgi:hypothetical protein